MPRSFSIAASLLLATLAGLVAPLPANEGARAERAGPVLIHARKIFTAAPAGAAVGRVLEPGSILIVDGKIQAIGKDLKAPIGTRVVDLGEQVVMPGVVLATSSLAGAADSEESIAANYHAIDGFDLFGNYTPLLLGGVTTAYLSPGVDRLVSGQGAVVKLAAKGGRSRALRAVLDLEVNLGEAALRPPPKINYPIPPSSDNPIEPALRQMPTTRLGQLLGLREALLAAENAPRTDLAGVALREAMGARTRLRIHADEARDLIRALQAAQEFGHPAVIVGANDGGRIRDELKAAGYPVVVEIGLSLNAPPGDRVVSEDMMELRPETAAQLVQAGLKVALSTPFRGMPAEILLSGAVAVRGGLDPLQAIDSLTRVPAEILGVDANVGSLQVGKDADFLVLSADPFQRSSHVQSVYLDGKQAVSRTPPEKSTSATVIRAGTLLPVSGPAIRNGAILLQDGKIVAVGHDVPVPGHARIIDAGPEAVITPGFLDCNSNLEFGGDRSAVGMDLDPVRLVADASKEALDVAQSGVTTSLQQSAAVAASGCRVTAVKTAGASRSERVVDELAAVKFSWRDRSDPIQQASTFQGLLKKGKEYHEKWKKYYEELKKWEEEQASGTAKKVEPKKEEKSAEADVQTEKRSDPLTGKWELELTGPMPEPQQIVMYLKLEGSAVTGTMTALGGGDETVTVSGTFADGALSLALDIEGPMGPIKVEAQISDDQFSGKFVISEQFSLDLNGRRTEKEFKEITVVKKRKKESDGRPVEPDIVPDLEPYRRLFGGEIPVLLDVDSAIAIHRAIEIFVKEYELPLVLLGGEELGRVMAEAAGQVQGVVVPAQVQYATRDTLTVPASEYSQQGLNVAFQSGGRNAARGLPLNAAYAVRLGMSPRGALRGLTLGAAEMFRIDDRVGSLDAGKDGDVLVFSGDPFDLSSQLVHVFVNGEEVKREAIQ